MIGRPKSPEAKMIWAAPAIGWDVILLEELVKSRCIGCTRIFLARRLNDMLIKTLLVPGIMFALRS